VPDISISDLPALLIGEDRVVSPGYRLLQFARRFGELIGMGGWRRYAEATLPHPLNGPDENSAGRWLDIHNRFPNLIAISEYRREAVIGVHVQPYIGSVS
jgi:hypothetical protein